MVELFGRYSGETSLITAYLAGVDRAVISEVPFDVDRLGELLVGRQAREPVELRDGDHLRGRDARRAARWCSSGEEDAYGHRKLGGIGELTRRAAQGATPART